MKVSRHPIGLEQTYLFTHIIILYNRSKNSTETAVKALKIQ
jgi:hypothetical protein